MKDSLASALSRGVPFEAWKAAFAEELALGWSPANPGRLETAIRTQLQTQYMAARVGSLRAQTEKYPLWRFTAIMDTKTSDLCRQCNDTVLPADDRWWRDHTPPLHFNCRSTIVGVKKGERDERGPRVHADPGFGNPEEYLDAQ